MCNESFKRILVGIDGSNASVTAARLAARLAGAFSSELLLVHVIKPPTTMTSPELLAALPNVRLGLRDTAEQLLASISRRLPPEVAAQHLIDEGNTPAKILQAAKKWNADLIVLGTHGNNRLSCRTTDTVVHNTNCPVLIAREPDTAFDNPLTDFNAHYTLEAYAQ